MPILSSFTKESQEIPSRVASQKQVGGDFKLLPATIHDPKITEIQTKLGLHVVIICSFLVTGVSDWTYGQVTMHSHPPVLIRQIQN